MQQSRYLTSADRGLGFGEPANYLGRFLGNRKGIERRAVHQPVHQVRQIGRHAGIPFFDGAAMPDHPAVRLAEMLGDRTSLADNQRFMVQALLLESVG